MLHNILCCFIVNILFFFSQRRMADLLLLQGIPVYGSTFFLAVFYDMVSYSSWALAWVEHLYITSLSYLSNISIKMRWRKYRKYCYFSKSLFIPMSMPWVSFKTFLPAENIEWYFLGFKKRYCNNGYFPYISQ